MEFNNLNLALINQVTESTLPLTRTNPAIQIPARAGSGCLIVYKDRLFFVCVQAISDKSGLQIAFGTGNETYPLPGLQFMESFGVEAPELAAPVLHELNSLSLCYAEIKDALDMSRYEIQLGALTIPAEEQKTIFSHLDYAPSKGEAFVFYGNMGRDLPGEGMVQPDKTVSSAQYADKTGSFERFLLDASTLESIDIKAIMGAPMFSETGAPVAFIALADPEKKILYAFSAITLQEKLDNYIELNPPYVADDGLENFHVEPVKGDYVTYSVLYGTNRNAVQKKDKLSFGSARDHNLHLGYCNVSIPLKHEKGEVERPSWFRDLFYDESPQKYFTILSNEQTEEAIFTDLLRQKIGHSDEKDVLLFVHGFNVSFNEAMMRAAQVGYDLNFKGGVTAFSWPSLGTITGYIADSDSAKYSRKHLSAFIKLLMQPGARKLHILAHSMGNVVLTEALLQLKEEGLFPNPIIQQVILAAPDLDKDIFLNQVLPAIKGGSKFTLYASDKDKALIVSKKIRKGYSRLGEGGEDIVIVDGLDSVDASRVDTSLLGHGYFSDTESLLNDIHLVMLNLPPVKRELDGISKLIGGLSKEYWVFRKT